MADEINADNFYITCGAAASLCICFRALTESEEDEYMAYYLVLDYSVESAYLRYHYKGNARSVRCVKDN